MTSVRVELTFYLFVHMTANNTKKPKKNKDENELNNYHVQLIISRTLKALNAKEEAFKEHHQNDSDLDLIACFMDEAERLGHTPRQGEIEGWRYLLERFGSWDELLEASGLKAFTIEEPYKRYSLFLDEYEHQSLLYAEHKKYKKQRSRERKIEQAQRKKQQEAYLLEHPEAAKKKRKKKASAEPENHAKENAAVVLKDTPSSKEEANE